MILKLFPKNPLVVLFFFLFLSWGFCQSNSNTTCSNCTECKNCSGTQVSNSINCTDCTNCTNVVNCYQCVDVHNSSNVSNSQTVYNSSMVFNSQNIYNSINVTNSDTCYGCMNCYTCLSCTNCAGYYCQNDEGCRNSRWLFDWIEPADNDTKAWNCSNKVVNDWYFNKGGYERPDYLTNAVTNNRDLSFCQQFNGNRSCCNQQTTNQIQDIFNHYKSTLELRATKKINDLKNVFDEYKAIDLSQMGEYKTAIQQGIIEEMRQIKTTIYTIAQNMATCGRSMLTYVSGMLCLGCLPDWRWEKYILTNDPNLQLSVDKFNPEEKPNFTINLNTDPLKLSVFIGRQICEDVYSNCQPIMNDFNTFSNNSALAVGGFADEITNNQWSFNLFNTTEKIAIRSNVTVQVQNLSKRNVSWITPTGNTAAVDTKTVPTYNPTPGQQAMANFKSSLEGLGAEYPYDPVAYFNFNPSINFETPIIMNSEMCQLMTQSYMCVFCSSSEANSSCSSTANVFYQIESETDRQYRDYSAYFFQVKVVYLEYHNGADVIIRNLLFPPFREGEIFIQLQGTTWDYQKQYFQVLESNIVNQYNIFTKVRSSQDEFRIWNDEYWMNFIYSPALNQGGTFFKSMSQSFPSFQPNGTYEFICDLTTNCSLCQNGVCMNATNYVPYCEDCHFSNVKIQADCQMGGCITCLYIGGGVLPYNDTDIDAEDLDDEPMDKCYIRANNPFYYPNSDPYYAPFYRESDEANFGLMETLFDLTNQADIPWNIAQIGQWFYKIPGSEYFSVVNVMRVSQSIIIPNTTNCTHYDYILPCDLNNPINQCKRWLCNFIIDGFFPNFKIIYDPQNSNNTVYDALFVNSSVFSYDLYLQTQQDIQQGDIGSAWNLSYGSPDPNANSTYYDVAYWGPDTTPLSNLQITVDGITENTDIISYVQAEEQDIWGIRNRVAFIVMVIAYICVVLG